MSDIVQLGAPILRENAHKIIDFNHPTLKQLIHKMLSYLKDSQGVGLAAPQINQSYRVLVIASKPTPRYPNAPLMKPKVMINPSFKQCSEQQQKEWEGCLSIPSIRALVPRYQQILVHYQDSHGHFHQLALEGFIARIFQHEYDHLQGLVYLDRVENNHDIISETEFFKLPPLNNHPS